MDAEFIDYVCSSCLYGRLIGKIGGGYRFAECGWERNKKNLEQRRKARTGTSVETLAECPDRARSARHAGL